ncbi:MAG: hypothetical protein IT530_02275 [Burkholderiales bacterium]|nr:hypothetical protein [Burkholderiales bacterium]
MKQDPKRTGRPRRDLTEAQKTRICNEVALGRSLRKVLKAKGMPSMPKLLSELDRDAGFASRYARARARGIELHIDQIIDLADSATPQNAQAVRLRVDTRKWLASKLVPKVYGDRLDLAGGVAVVDVENPDGLAAARRIAWALKVGQEELDRQESAARPRLPAPASPSPPSDPEPPHQPDEPEGRVIDVTPTPRVQSPGHFNRREQFGD